MRKLMMLIVVVVISIFTFVVYSNAETCNYECHESKYEPCIKSGTRKGICNSLKQKCIKKCEVERKDKEKSENSSDIVHDYGIIKTNAKNKRYSYSNQRGSYKSYYSARMTIKVIVKAPNVKKGTGTIYVEGVVKYNRRYAYNTILDVPDSKREKEEWTVFIDDGWGEQEITLFFDVRKKNYQTYKIRGFEVQECTAEITNVSEWK